METTFYSLASKSNFNLALRHFYKVTDVVDEVEKGINIADYINDLIDDNDIHQDQILPIVGSVIRDKFGYSYNSFNIPSTISDFGKISSETLKWTALDIVLVYYNPSGLVMLLNPKNPEHWEKIRELVSEQLLVIYTKFLKEKNSKIESEAITAIEEMITGKDVFINKEFIDQTKMVKAPVQKKETTTPVGAAVGTTAAVNAAVGKKKATPKYAVEVSNELFHNGNVEAWKKIVESYSTKYPDLDVIIYFKDEVINDINSLFKWGKVKHGDSIMFQVAGEDIRGVSKLQKYLYEGASHRFEQFLKIGVGKVLNLF